MQNTGDPTTLAPEICVEIMSESNDWNEMEEKIALYREAGAEEVWDVDQEDEVRFFGEEELERGSRPPFLPPCSPDVPLASTCTGLLLLSHPFPFRWAGVRTPSPTCA